MTENTAKIIKLSCREGEIKLGNNHMMRHVCILRTFYWMCVCFDF
jgi:hypothetical protein